MAQPTIEDREKLTKFLSDTYELLDEIIQNGRDHLGNTIIPNESLIFFQNAWKEYQEQCPLDRARAVIMATRDDQFIWAGLYGEQLILKLHVINQFRNKFNNFGGAKWIKKLLDAIDRVLDSLIAATGIDEALKELKDILSDSADQG